MIYAVILVLFLLAGQAAATEADFYVTDLEPLTHVTDFESLTLAPGEMAILNVTFKNLGTRYAIYLSATLDPDDTSPIDVIGIKEKYLGKAKEAEEETGYFGIVRQNDELTVSYLIHVKSDAKEDVYIIPLVLDWEDNTLTRKNETLPLGIRIKGDTVLKVAKVRTTPLELKRDREKNEVTITLENQGKTKAKSVKVNLELKDFFSKAYSNSNSDFILEILPESTHDFVLGFDIDENASPGTYLLPLTISYRSGEKEYVQEENISLKINTKADFKVLEVKTEPERINPGDTFRISISLKNIGSRDAEAVKVVLKTKSFFSGVKSDYLGDMDEGAVKLATFELKTDRDTLADNYENDIKVIWLEGDKREEEVMSFGTAITPSKNGKTLKMIVGALLLAGLVGLVWRKKK